MLKEMDFGRMWRNHVENCISSHALSVLVNGNPTREFRMEKGLHQGDPLSPFFFNMAVDDLSTLFRKVEGLIFKKFIFGEDTVHISHLQFMDDTILFLQPKVEYLRNARRIMRCYKLASGLRINFQKTSVVMVGKCRDPERNWTGTFTVNSFCQCLRGDQTWVTSDFKEIWQGLCPPKIKLFVWQHIHDRVLIKEVLSRNQKVFKDGLVDLVVMEDMVKDVISAEILAITKAREFVMTKPKLADRNLVMVSDSKVAVDWVNNSGFGSLNHA
ncbi:hypothetical protein Ddye_001056 [Dipteronia dyeriana]|uniref:Reverse transcriptase domain-containing protein n=1 Tax=Dipteronia dyeriana TaxID=168575 RepID=A0AAD9XN94_9ROSI|nr:hypothetical protein Ddye_001056 [Dipteronia dyeriana]